MTYEENQYLVHYGIKGQKHGVRRFQNEDGTLTAEGKERYGSMKDRGDSGFKKWSPFTNEAGNYAFAKWRLRRHDKNLSKVNSKYDRKIEKQKQALKDIDSQAKKNPKEAAMIKDILNEAKRGTQAKIDKLESKKAKKAAKYESKKAAQGAANANLDAYRKHSSGAKLFLQNTMMTPVLANAYRHARARGNSRIGSLVEAGTPIGGLLRMHRDKKKYGKRIVYSDILENEYDASAMDRD